MRRQSRPGVLITTILGVAVGAVSLTGGNTQSLTTLAESQGSPGGLSLLAGYSHHKLGALDTARGTISKAGGPEIIYDIGHNAGDKASGYARRIPRAWTITQAGLGGTAVITMDESREVLIVTIGGVANFEGQHVKTTRDVAEVLAMAFSYDLSKDAIR